MLDAKESLDEVLDGDGISEWLKKYGGNVQYLGYKQQAAMNELVAETQARIGNEEMDMMVAS